MKTPVRQALNGSFNCIEINRMFYYQIETLLWGHSEAE